MVSLVGIVGEVIVGAIIIAPILWLVGRAMVGGDKAKFTDAIWIVVLGVVINAVLGVFIQGTLGLIVTLIVWIALIKHFFDASWGKAIVIGIVAIVVLVAVLFILVALGVAALIGLGSIL
jgi:hypothetical protein